jgi:hypothetical protein
LVSCCRRFDDKRRFNRRFQYIAIRRRGRRPVLSREGRGGRYRCRSAKLPIKMKALANWAGEVAAKDFSIDHENSRDVFASGVYAYFPASRSEAPYWLNRESVPSTEFEVAPGFAQRLGKPIYVEHGLHQFKQWLISVIVESKTHIAVVDNGAGQQKVTFTGNIADTFLSEQVMANCNAILQSILDDATVRFV